MKTTLKALILLATLTGIARAEGWLTVSPGRDFMQGRGATVALDADHPLTNKLSLTYGLSYAAFTEYRDSIGSFGFQYGVSDRLKVGVGYSYDRFFSIRSQDSSYYKNLHADVKYRLW